MEFPAPGPYPSRRSAVLADNVVATSQPLAAQAGLSMLHRGGNALDAALATAIALTVVEPTGCGLGSDGFAILWDGEGTARAQRVRAIAGRLGGRTVRRKRAACPSAAGSR